MENHCLYKIQRFHVLVTPESEQLKVTALNLLEASRLSGRFPASRPTSPTASLPFSKKCVFSYYDTLSWGGELHSEGARSGGPFGKKIPLPGKSKGLFHYDSMDRY
jgi:hypothetical protein